MSTKTLEEKETPATGPTPGRIEHFINGKHVRGGGRTSDVFNPATGEVTAKVALASSGGSGRGGCGRARGFSRLVAALVTQAFAVSFSIQSVDRKASRRTCGDDHP